MLLSRALNRGYGSGRARWPLEFGLLSHDALWVMDEVQLMDVGLATSAQLQAFHDADAAGSLRPRHSWWMSATLQPSWLKSVDTDARHAVWSSTRTELPARERDTALGRAVKNLSTTSISAGDPDVFARRVLDSHQHSNGGESGRITLAICNTVRRASETFERLLALSPTQTVHLAHSRFRPYERALWRQAFLSRDACRPGSDRIIVATQVVEAGVDISASALVTELAPWPSLVQRFGRCARYGGSGSVLVVDRGREEVDALPYAPADLDAAWLALARIGESGADVGIASLEEFEAGLTERDRADLYPYQPRHLLLRREFDELFDTTPDLTGADLDISRFIRSGSERDVLIFWADLPPAQRGARSAGPLRDRRPQREELCSVPFLEARDWLCGKQPKAGRGEVLRAGVRAWVWDYIDGDWVPVRRSLLTPGRVVCVAADAGGYRLDRGFDAGSIGKVEPVPVRPLSAATEADERADASEGAEDLSAGAWKTIGFHGREVGELALAIAEAIPVPAHLRRVLSLAGRWHDLGKAHPAFQGAIRSPERPLRSDLAKAPPAAWLRPPGSYRTADDSESRPGFRHELASALALFAVLGRCQPRHPALLGDCIEALELVGRAALDESSVSAPTSLEREVLLCSAAEFDLLAYLVASHHGKVRATLDAGPRDQDYRDRDGRGLPIRGVRNRDVLPSLSLDDGHPALPELSLSLEPATLGLSAVTGRSWRERTLELQSTFGPGALAWLEALLIAADRRASRLATSDPALVPVEPSP